MSTTFETRGGESWADVARAVYGSERGERGIALANPGLAEPLPPGERLQIPTRVETPEVLTDAAELDEVAVRINGRRFRWWESVTLRRAADSVDTFELSAPFEPDESEFRENFRPLAYQGVSVAIGGEPFFNGTMLAVAPSSTAEARTVTAAGYSLPGVLEDCTASGDTPSLEFIGLNLREIAEELLDPFGLRVVFEDGAEPGMAFLDVSIGAGQAVMPFLAQLAQQRALVIGSNRAGDLVFRQSAQPGNPVAVFTPDQPGPVRTVTPQFRPQQYYSHITGMEPEIIGITGGRVTIRNRRLDAIRPHVFNVPDTQDTDLETAVQAKVGRMFGDVAAFTVGVTTWRDPSGALWRPNTTVQLHWPGAMIYRPYEFLIRAVELEAVGDRRAASLELVMPGAYRGEVPENLPWD